MRSPDRKALGAAIAAGCVALALTACATGRPAAAARSRTSSSPGSGSAAANGATTNVNATSVTGETLRQRAQAAAAALLRSFAVPPGGQRLTGPPSLPGAVLTTPASYLGAIWEVHLTGFWEASGNPQALLAWEQAHLKARFTLGDAGNGPPVWDRGFQLAAEGPLVTRELDVEVASAGDGKTGIRVDAWVAWRPPRPAATLIPPAAQVVTIAESTSGGTTAPATTAPSPAGSASTRAGSARAGSSGAGSSGAGSSGPGSAAGRLPAPVTITDPATVRRLAALVNGLPLSTIPPDTPCPFAPGPVLSLTFRARAGGAVLATVQTDQPCDGVTLTIGGKQQPTLENEPTLDGRIRTLAALPRKLS
jgi:hypothetical protein